MATLEELLIKIGVDDSAADGIDNVKNEFDGLEDTIDSASSSVDSFFSGLSSGVGAVIGAVGSIASTLGLDDIPGQAMDAAKSISTTNASLTGIYGSAEQAGDMMSYINKEFAGTRVGGQAVNDLAVNLAYMGIEGDEATTIMHNLVDSIEFMGGSEENIESVSGALIDAQNNGVVFNDTLNQLSENGVPVFDLLTDKLGLTEQELKDLASSGELSTDTLLEALGDFDSEYAQIIQEGIGEVRNTWDYQWDAMKNAVSTALGGMIDEFMQTETAQQIMSDLTDIIEGIPETIQGLADKLQSSGIVDGFISIYDAAVGLGENAMPIVEGFFEFFKGDGDVVASVLDAIAGAFEAIAAGLDKVPEPVLDFIGQFLGALVTSGLIVAAAIKAIAIAMGIWNAVMYASPITWIIAGIILLIAVIALIIVYWDEIAAKTGEVWDWIKEKLAEVWDWIKELFTSAWEWLVDLVTGLWESISEGFQTGVQWIIDAVQGGLEWLLDLFMAWHPLGIIISHWDSIVEAFEAGIQWAKDLVQAGIDNVLSFFRKVGEVPGMVGGFFSDMVSQAASYIGNLLSDVRAIPGKIKSAIGNLGSLLKNAGRQIIQGLINGVTGMIGSLRNKFSEITNMIPDWKGPESVDLKLLEGPGEDIMDGLMNGIDGRVGDLRSTLGGITSSIPGMVGAGTSSSRFGDPTKVVIDFKNLGRSKLAEAVREAVRIEGGGDVGAAFNTTRG